MGRAIVAVLVFAVVACGDGDVRTVRLERVTPAVDPSCGAPEDARNITVTARGDFPPESAAQTDPIAGGEIEITRFPEATRVLEVRVEGVGGEERTVGRTAEVDFADLADGDTVHVFMAPRRRFCRVDGLARGRIRPHAVRVGGGVLVVGGIDGAGQGVAAAERYDPTLGGFVPVAGTLYDDGLLGASMTRLADGRVAIVGGAETAYQLYESDTDELGQPSFLAGGRAYHAAVELADGRLLLAGGCAEVTAAGACDFATARLDSVLLDVDSGETSPGPSLAVARAGGVAVREADGRVLISGGVSEEGEPVAQAERVSPFGGAGQGIAQVTGRPVPLQSGAALAAYADGAPGADVFVVPPGGATASRVSPATAARMGATVTALDDGAALALGGGVDGVELYAPARGAFTAIGSAPAALRDHAAVLLEDGSVLVLGGRDGDGEASADAWVYRHDLTGAYTAQFNLADAAQGELLSPRDPARVAVGAAPNRYVLSGTDGADDLPSEWLIAGGPRFVEPMVSVRAGVVSGGLAILLGFRSASDYHYVELRGGRSARLWRVQGGERADTGCAGPAVDGALLAAMATNPTIATDVRAGELSVEIGGARALSCALDDAIPRGAIGVGVIGGETASIELDQIAGVR